MENRFGVKDFILFLLLVALLVSVWLAMKQFDRQWEEVRAVRQRLDEQGQDLRNIRQTLNNGVALAAPTTAPTRPGAVAASAPADTTDPFARIRAAQAMPGYAQGGWLVDAFGNNVGKLTPLLSTDAYASTVQSFVLESLATRDPETLEWKPLLSTKWEVVDNTAVWGKYVQSQLQKGERRTERDITNDEAYQKLPENSPERRTYTEQEKQKTRTEQDILHDEALPPAIQAKFTMRQGPRFSDGTPLTADDVLFTYQFIMDPRINCPRDKAYLSRISKLEKTGPDEVTFTFREPYFQAFELAAGMSILPGHFYSRFKPEEFNNSVGLLLGSGPYRLPDPASWKPGALIQVVRNDRYWGVQPAFDRMVWREIPNDAANLAAFRNGDTDVFGAFPEQYREMIADQGLVSRTQHYEYQNPVGGYRYIAWNQQRNGKPTMFADKRVRQALTMLLDRERMIQEIMLGYAVLATGPFNPLSKQFNPEVKPWPYDVERAKSLLREAGFEDRNGDGIIEDASGRPFEFKLTYPSGNANYEKMVLFIKDAYARAGIALKPDPLDWAVMVERLNQKNFEAITLGWTAGIESDIYQMFDSSQAVADGDNFMSYRSADLDRVIRQARRTVREDERMPLWREAHQIIHDDQPYTFLSFGKSLVFLDGRIKNVQITKLGLNGREEWFVPAGQQRVAR